MEDFDIMTTATLRPELLKCTFDSHIKYLFKDDIKSASLCINVDKTGCEPNEQYDKFQEIMQYIDTIPFKRVSINVSAEPSFPRAFYWCLGQIGNRLTFNLEEDWEMVHDVDFRAMVGAFDNYNSIVHLRLSQFESTEDERLKQWNKFIPWNGEWYEVPRNLRGTIGFCGHPSLNRTSFLMFFATVIDKNRNPEKQIKGSYPAILNSRFGVFQEQYTPASIVDIGRQWMAENGWKKQGDKSNFTNWCRAE